MRLGILASHPVQYYAPLYRELARRMDLEVLYANNPTPQQQAAAGFGTAFDWDVDLLSGYSHRFLRNVATVPGTHTFSGCDTPEIGGILRAGRYGALLVMGWHLKSFVQGTVAAKRAGIPVLVRGDSQLTTPRSVAKLALKAILYPALLRLFDAALFVGTRNRAYYTHYGYPQHRLFSVPHCVDTDWFAKRATRDAADQLRAAAGIPADLPLVLFAGKLIDFKRPLDVVDAVSLLPAPRKPGVVIAGAGSLQPNLERRARERGVALFSLGFCNQTRMPAAYAAAHVLVLPSTGRETWGLVCNEALACGTPIIVSDAVGCAPDLARDGVAGRSFRQGDTVDLARCLDAVLQNPPAANDILRLSDAHTIATAVAGIEEALAAVASHRH